MTVKELAKEAWEVALGIAKTVPAKLSWREAMRLLRASLPSALCERAVGILVLALVLAAFGMVMYLARYLSNSTTPLP